MDKQEIQKLRKEIAESWEGFVNDSYNFNKLFEHVALLSSSVDSVLKKLEDDKENE